MQKSLFRNSVALIVALTVTLKHRREGLQIQPGSLRFYLIRAVAGSVGVFANFYAIDHLVLSDASMLSKTSPFFAVVFSVLLLKEKISKRQGLAILSAFAGCLFIIKPSLTNLDFFPALIAFVGGMGAGLAYTMVRILSNYQARSSTIVLIFSAFTTGVSLPFALLHYVPMTAQQALSLLLAGLLAACGQYAVTAAYTFAPAREISIYDYTQVIFSALWGRLLFLQLPDALSVLGYILIALAMFLNTFRGRWHACANP